MHKKRYEFIYIMKMTLFPKVQVNELSSKKKGIAKDVLSLLTKIDCQIVHFIT